MYICHLLKRKFEVLYSMTEEDHTKATKTTTKKTATKSAAIMKFNYNEPDRCSITGQTEKEAGVLFSIDHVKLSPDAVQVLNAQLATFRKQQRGG